MSSTSGSPVRTRPKSLTERLLLRGGAAALARRLHRGRGLVLAYHNIIPDGESAAGDTSLHLPEGRFKEQLEILAEEDIEVLPLEELIGSLWTKPTGKRRVAITFDDAYSGAVEIGIKAVVEHRLPATVFVVPGLLGGQAFWWDALASPTNGLDREIREEALTALRGQNEEVLGWARRDGIRIRSIPPHSLTASSSSLRHAAAQPGITLASHTWSHPNLKRLTQEECRLELARAAEWLRSECGQAPGLLSYPYGLHGPTAERAASALGHTGGFGIAGGWLPRDRSDCYQMPRLNVPANVSREGFILRLAGLLT